jgi:hypothetical protein
VTSHARAPPPAQSDMRRLLAHVREGRNGWWSSMEEGAASAAGGNLPLLWRTQQAAAGGSVAPTPAAVAR